MYLVNPMSDAKHLVLRILPGAITDTMREQDVPRALRGAVRERVKLLHELSQGREPEIVLTMCRLWIEHGRELCERYDSPRRGPTGRDVRCKCAKFWRDFMPR